MLRILLIISLVGYVLYKFGLFRFQVNQHPPHQNFNRRPPNGNINIDPTKQTPKKKSDFKGGEYVDYEEVK